MKTRSIPNADALLIIEESILAGSSVRLLVRGNSMSPQLLDGVDVVNLHPCNPSELKIGEIILFRFKERFLLHRIIQIANPDGSDLNTTTIITKGDALKITETITFADVIAVAEVPRHTTINKMLRYLFVFSCRLRNYFYRKI
jgi:signal peptidase I